MAEYNAEELEFLQTVGQHLRALREERRISQESLAEKSGVERSYIGKLERGVQNASLLKLRQLANGLGIEPSRLLEFSILAAKEN